MEIVTGALPSVLTKLAELLVGEYNLQTGVKGEIMFLQAELESMQGALLKISDTPVDQLDIQNKIWARDLRELSYDIEDSIDIFMVRGDITELSKLHGINKFIDRSVGLFRKGKVRHRIANEIRDIKSRVTEVHKRRQRYEFINHGFGKPVSAPMDPRLFAQYKDVKELVGIDDTRDELIKIMMEENGVPMQHGKVVSIVGFGGLGKTTLAYAVYEKLREQFDCWAFVSVSQTPDMRKLFKGMLYQLVKQLIIRRNKETLDGMKDDLYQLYNISNIEEALDDKQLIHELRDTLRKRRYLIVFDDIWDISVWKNIRCALPEDSDHGYRIIITTRISHVAEEVGGPYTLKPLCIDNSKILFYRRIFGNEYRGKCPDEQIEEVSNKILEKCAGVPLAIITIASLLANKERNKMEWYTVCNLIGTGLENSLDVKNMRKILSLSYYDLPTHLRTCLLYLTMFPEDYNIHKDRLIWMWIAEGFIQHENQLGRPFELGENYFSELINRSMIQPVYNEYYDMVIGCRTHDMVLDLIHFLSCEENFVSIYKNVEHTSSSSKIRRLSCQNRNADHATPQDAGKMQHVRSVVVFPSVADLMPDLQSFRVLRVLDLHGCLLSQSYTLQCLGNLFNLRYLGLGKTHVAQLPEEIGSLKFLQTLDVTGNQISILPSTIVQLRNLMCLRIDKHTSVPKGIRNLRSLEQLSQLCIDHSMVVIEELSHLMELRVLNIDCSTRWNICLEKSLVECISKMQSIHTLFISFYGVCNLTGLAAPQNLQRLGLDGWISTLPAWMNPSLLPNLSFLDIAVRELRQEHVGILGRLPALRYLWLVVDWEHHRIFDRLVIGASSFPCLVECVLSGFTVCVMFRQGAMPRLASLQFMFTVSTMSEISYSHDCFDMGMENLPSLQFVTIDFRTVGASRKEIDEAEYALRRAIEIHPNHPTLFFEE